MELVPGTSKQAIIGITDWFGELKQKSPARQGPASIHSTLLLSFPCCDLLDVWQPRSLRLDDNAGMATSQDSYESYGVRVLECTHEGKRLANDRDAIDLIGEAIRIDARMIVIPVERFDPDFFRLRTRIAGEIVQKFVQYRRHLVILGDISAYVSASPTFQAFVNEANLGVAIWFVADHADLQRRLERHKI